MDPDLAPALESDTAGTPNAIGTDLISRVNNIISSSEFVAKKLMNMRRTRKNRKMFTISVNLSDRFATPLQIWLDKILVLSGDERILSVKSSYENGDLLFTQLEDQTRFFQVEGHTLQVSLMKPKSGIDLFKDELRGSLDDGAWNRDPYLLFSGSSMEAMEALKRQFVEIRKEHKAKHGEQPQLITLSPFRYEVNSSKTLLPRSMESVVLADGQMESIVGSMERFINSERIYIERGVPYHRGYMFSGPPGTGKSSLVKVLASHFGRDLYYFSLSSVNSDLDLARAFERIGPKGILLLEDIDVFSVVQTREKEAGQFSDERLTLSGLLNCLDGVMTPHGLMTIMTTNHAERIDPALMRPGRVDQHEVLGLCTGKQSDRIFEAFFGRSPSSTLGLENISPAQIQEVLKNHMYDPDTAETELREKFQ